MSGRPPDGWRRSMTAAAMPPGKMPAQRCAAQGAPGRPHRAEGAEYAELPGRALRAASYSAWAKGLQAHLYETARADVSGSDAFKAASKAGESEGDFRARLALAAREKRDAAVAELRKRWQAKLLQLAGPDPPRRGAARARAEPALAAEDADRACPSAARSSARCSAARPSPPRMSGASARGALGHAHRARIAGRRRAPRKASKCCSSASRTRSAKSKPKSRGSKPRWMPTTHCAAPVEVPARKSDIAVGEVALVWAPWRKGADGFPAPAYD